MKKVVEGNILNPLPVALVGTLIRGRPNYAVIGYMSPFDFGRHVFFSLYNKRYTWVGIQENKTFSVNLPSEDMMKEVLTCGSKSGRDVDKSLLFHNFYGDLETAPMIKECPLNMECSVTDILDYDPSKGIIGRVVKSYVNPEFLTDGNINMQAVKLIAWTTGGDFAYYRLGEKVVLPVDKTK
jgi:flavin reductase (DIM6/NTAB) family NADH-FMN oxidoreductase RutF